MAPIRRPKKRLKKTVAARAVAKAEALLQAEKDQAKQKIEREKEKLQRKKALKKERERQAKALRKAAEREAKQRAQAEAAAERARVRAEAAREKEQARQAKERERQEHLAAKEAARVAKENERARVAAERLAAKENKANERKRRDEERARAKAAAEAERLRKQQEKAETKERVAREKQEAKERAAVERAELKAAREKEKAEQLAKKKAEAAAKKRARARAREVEQDLKENTRLQEKRLGTKPADLVIGILTALGARPDVRIEHDERGPALDRDELARRAEDLPPEVLAWYGAVGPVTYSWRSEGSSGNAAGGRLVLPPIDELSWTPRGRYLLNSAIGVEAGEWSSLEEFLLAGIRTFFSWDDSFQSLGSTSAPRFTPRAELVAALTHQEVEEKTARALVDLLSDSAHLLLHESTIDEGRRRREIVTSAAEHTELSVSLVEALHSGPPVDKQEWQRALKRHLDFIERSPGGSFEVSAKEALPTAVYHPPNGGSSTGQANFSGEHLRGFKARSANLSWANFCGSWGEEAALPGTNLTGSCFAYARFEYANFQGANLTGCDFSGARLVGADFRRAVLKETNFEKADLTGANFAGAVTAGTKFGGANVSKIRY